MQACSGKFHPIVQWFYFDSLESLPEKLEAMPNESTAAPMGSRYDGQVAVFGAQFQKSLEKLKYFVVSFAADRGPPSAEHSMCSHYLFL